MANNSVVSLLVPLIWAFEIFPSKCQTRNLRVQMKNKDRSTKAFFLKKKEKKSRHLSCQRGYVATQKVRHVLSTLVPHWRGICDIPFEGSRLSRRLEWAEWADRLTAGWARRGYGWTPRPPCALGPATVHQAPRPLARDDAVCWFKEPLKAGRVDFARRGASGHGVCLSLAVCAGGHNTVLR